MAHDAFFWIAKAVAFAQRRAQIIVHLFTDNSGQFLKFLSLIPSFKVPISEITQCRIDQHRYGFCRLVYCNSEGRSL